MAGSLQVKKWAILLVFVLLHGPIAYNFYLLSRDTIRGDSSADRILVKPRYGIMRVPEIGLAKECQAVNRISADFAQVYFPARIASAKAYTAETPDPWHRPSRYAPFIHLFCQYSLGKLPYGYASFMNILIQVLLLYASFIFAFRILQIERFLLPALLLVNLCLFLTPAGLSWFERGQFSVYVALAHLWLCLGMIRRNPYCLFLAALFAYVKWTAFPFIFVAVAVWVLTSKNWVELKGRIGMAAVIPLTVAALFLFNLREGLAFLAGLVEQEKTFHPDGLSLVFLLPRYWVKALPLILIVPGWLYLWKSRKDFVSLMPYLAAVGILSLLYPTLAYDYSTSCLLGFIPLLIHWAERENPGRHARQLKDSGHLVPMRRIFGVRWLDTAFPGGGAALPRAR